jgi:hypothetical protein
LKLNTKHSYLKHFYKIASGLLFVITTFAGFGQNNILLTPWEEPQVGRAQLLAESDGRTFAGYTIAVNQELDKVINAGETSYSKLVYVKDAEALTVFFNNWYVSNTSIVNITNLKTKEVNTIPSILIENNTTDLFSTGEITGDSLLIEIISNQELTQIPQITEVGIIVTTLNKLNRSGSCQVDVVCSEGNGHDDQINSVVRILVKADNSLFWCSGVLVNSATYDCTPYVLSAMHCTIDSETIDFNQFTFYFNYQKSVCGGGSSSTSQRMNGCVKRADSNDDGGRKGSDFVLMELNSQIPSSYNAFYAGWSVKGVSSGSGIGVHHPNGDEKTISTYNTFLSSVSFSETAPSNTHWEVKWTATPNGHGTTEGGSSGSPIFNSNGLVIGTLTGGGSSCLNKNAPDFYGKMSYHWIGNPNDANQKLKVWLDPANTGTKEVGGTYIPCASPNPEDAAITNIRSENLACSSNYDLIYTVANFGAQVLERVNIRVIVNNNVISNFVHTTNLSTGAKDEVSTLINLSTGKNIIRIESSLPNGVVDSKRDNDVFETNVYKGSPAELVRIQVIADCNPEEISFDLFAADSTLLYSLPLGSISAGVNNFDFCLPSGYYFVELYDTGNNGLTNISCGDEGLIQVLDHNQQVLSIIKGNTDVYGGTASFGFAFDIEKNLEEADFRIVPNPIKETSQIEIQLENVFLVDVTLEIYDALGNRVLVSEAYVFKRVTVDITTLQKGTYTVRLILNGERKLVQRFIKL